MGKTLIQDMPRYRNRMKKIDKQRKMRLREAKENRDFRTILSIYAAQKEEDAKVLTEKQKLAVYLLTDFSHNYTYDYVAKYVGVSLETINNWRNQPRFIRECDKEIDRRRSFVRVHAFRNIHRSIVRGNIKDSWKYLEMTGDMKKTIAFEDNTGEKHMSDSELEAAIAKQTKKLLAPSSN